MVLYINSWNITVSISWIILSCLSQSSRRSVQRCTLRGLSKWDFVTLWWVSVTDGVSLLELCGWYSLVDGVGILTGDSKWDTVNLWCVGVSVAVTQGYGSWAQTLCSQRTPLFRFCGRFGTVVPRVQSNTSRTTCRPTGRFILLRLLCQCLYFCTCIFTVVQVCKKSTGDVDHRMSEDYRNENVLVRICWSNVDFNDDMSTWHTCARMKYRTFWVLKLTLTENFISSFQFSKSNVRCSTGVSCLSLMWCRNLNCFFTVSLC